MHLEIVSKKWSKRIDKGIFQSISHIVDFAESVPMHKLKGSSSYETNNKKWSGSDSFEHSLELVRTGHPELLKQIKQTKYQIYNQLIENNQQIYNFDVTGEQFDTGLYLSGEPECFISTDTQTSNKYISLVIKIGGQCGHSSDTLLKFGINTSILVNNLIQSGYYVAIYGVQVSDISYYSICLKKYQENLDMINLITILHPSFFRRIMFRLIEQQDNWKSCYGDGTYTIYNRLSQEEAEQLYNNHIYIDVDNFDLIRAEAHGSLACG